MNTERIDHELTRISTNEAGGRRRPRHENKLAGMAASGTTLKICPICGKEVSGGAPNRKYCSKECAYRAVLDAQKKAYVKKDKFCKICGKKIPEDRKGRNVKYCSEECAHQSVLEIHRRYRANDRELRLQAFGPSVISASVEGIVLTEKEAEEVRKALATPETERWAICKQMNRRQLSFLKRAYLRRHNLFSIARGSWT